MRLVPLRSVPDGVAFMFVNRDIVYESRGNGWYQVYGKSYNGGPWHDDGENPDVAVEEDIPDPSQTLSAFV